MGKKEELAPKYAAYIFRRREVSLGANFANFENIFHRHDIKNAYEAGWDEALKSILVDASKELPEYELDIWVINKKGEQFYCHRSKNAKVKAYKDQWCNYSGSDIVAWIRPSTFEQILKLNKDIVNRIKVDDV